MFVNRPATFIARLCQSNSNCLYVYMQFTIANNTTLLQNIFVGILKILYGQDDEIY